MLKESFNWGHLSWFSQNLASLPNWNFATKGAFSKYLKNKNDVKLVDYIGKIEKV